MKTKTYLMLLLAFFAAAGLKAQTDMTSYVYDPDFDVQGRSQWKTDGFGRQGNNTFPLKHGDYYRETWSGGTVGNYYIYQDIANLPVGTYTLTMACQNILQSNTNQVCTGAWIYANDQKKEFNKPGDYSVTCVVKDGNLRIGAETKNCTGNYVCIDYIRLSYQIVYEDVKDYLEQLLVDAENLDAHNGTPEREEMAAALEDLRTIMNSTSKDGLDAAVKRLQAAMTAYRFSLASPTNPMNMTDLISDPSFENWGNGWKFDVMHTQNNTSFRKVGDVYAETWTGGGNGVGDAKLWQVLENMPNGRYKLTAVAQNIQESSPSTKQKGCYLFANTNKTEVNVYGTYQLEFVNLGGDMTIGFETISATGNYVCVDDFHLYFLGADEAAEAAALADLISQGEALVGKDMNTSTKADLNKAIADAKALTGAEGRDAAYKALATAIDAAVASNALYVQLDGIIAKGETELATGKPNGQDKLQVAINSAKNLKASGDIDADKVATANNIMDNAIFAYRVMNGTGTVPKVTTGEVIVGSSAMVGRMSATGSNIIERGFCWAENPEPTVMDIHTSYSQTNDETNNSPVYIMYDVQPSTEYWVRAYALTKTYAVGYGDPVRVITLPKGETEYTFLWNGDDDHNEWLDNAMREATAYYNTWTAIKGFHPTANYSPGTETADCSYGGWINVGPWRCNTGTMVHEMMHGTGVGQHGRYWDSNLKDGIWWQGERANRICHFFENYDSSRGNYNCNGDGMHICYQGNGNDMQQIRSSLLMQALYEDGLPAVSDGACPFYSYESIDTLHYYITNCAYGANTKYLCESSTGKLAYRATASTDELLSDSTYAWNIIYDKMTGLYFIKNLKSGKYFRHTGSTVGLTATKPNTSDAIQLMPARISMDFNFGGTVVKMKPYWFARGNRVEYPNVIAMNSASATSVSTPTLDFSNSATKQFWVILTPEDVQAMVAGKNAMNQERLERLIAGSKTVAAARHREVTEGQDDAFMAVVNEVEQAKADYNASETEAAVNTLFGNLIDYLPAVEVLDSIDISFVMDDAELATGANWEGLPALTNGMLRTTNTPVFTATQAIPTKLPIGEYGLLVRGYQRPGTSSNAVKDYVAGTNNVRAFMTFNTKSQKLMHIAQGGASTKLNQGGTETNYSGIFVPTNLTATKAYLAAGRYDNLLKVKFTSAKAVTVGLKTTQTIENDQLVVDGMQLFYYGNPAMVDAIQQVEANEASNEVEGYYNLNGMRLSVPGQGITIVRYKDGRSVKIKY